MERTTDRPLKITIISHSDVIGQPAVATMRIKHTLEARGHTVRMLVFTKYTDDPTVRPVGNRPTSRLMRFGSERLRILLANGFRRSDLFKVSIANTGIDLSHDPDVADADIVMLGWINQGLLSLDNIRRIARTGKPIIWLMHDLWNSTGICHNPRQCTRYEHMCGNCQYLRRGRSERDLSRSTWWRKKQLYDRADIDFVAVSNHIADVAASSEIMNGRRVHVIPVPVAPDIFNPARSRNNPYGLPRDKHLITITAPRLDDQTKGLDVAIQAFNYLFDNDPMFTNDCEVLLIGSFNDDTVLNDMRFPYRRIGMVHDRTAMADIYALSDVILSTTVDETFGLTLLEGLAAGATPVSFGTGGQADVVQHKVNGYIARNGDPEDLAEGIKWAIGARLDRNQLHRDAVDRFSPDLVADRYDALFAEILERRDRGAQHVPTLAEIDRKIKDVTKNL